MRKITLLLLIISCSFIYAADNLTIDGVSYSVDTLANFKVGPGTQYIALRLQSAKRLDVYFLKSDLNNSYISFKSVLGKDSIYTGEQPSAMAKRKTKEGAMYIAGTNGDFYNTSGYVGLPIGCTVIDGQIATPPVSGWKSIAFDDQKLPGIGVLTYGVKVLKGTETWTVNRVNHLREANQLVLYNQHNGKFTHTNAYGTEILVQLIDGENWGLNKTIKAKVIKIELNKGNMAIPTGLAVLSGHGTAQTLLNTLNVNDEISIQTTMLLDGIASTYYNVVGGESRAPMLKNGVVEQTDIWNELHPRTGVGYSHDKKLLISCVVDGRGASAGVTTKQLAQLIQSAGAYTAFNMDGGGSSCMYVKEFGPMNATSDGSERAVANGLFAVSSAPTDNVIAEIKTYNSTIKLPKYGVYMPKILAYNQYGVLINKDLQNIVLSCDAQVGEIAADGRFVASGSHGGIVKARYNNVETQFSVELISSAKIAFRLDSVLVDSSREYPMQVQSVIGLNTMDVLPVALNWNAVDPSVCSVESGILKGIKNGSTLVIGSLGDFKDTIKVKVEIPQSAVLKADGFTAADWNLDASSALNATFDNTNLPNNWTGGGCVNFVFNSTRAPYIKLIRNLNLYSLPDTLKFTFNTSDISFSKLLVSLRANNSTSDFIKELNTFTPNIDNLASIPLATLFNTSDLAIYPIHLNYLNFYLNVLTAGRAYQLGLKEILLCYKDFSYSAVPSFFENGLSIYPNPVSNMLNIKFDNRYSGLFQLNLYASNGQIVYSDNMADITGNEYKINLKDMTAGVYVLKVDINKQQLTSKIFIQK